MDVHSSRTVVTRAVHMWAEADRTRMAWLAGCLARHSADDWGDLDSEDWASNDHGLGRQRGRLLSAYLLPSDFAGTTDETRVWVITDELEDPETATTILWPSDY
jgi:hypothetical protein